MIEALLMTCGATTDEGSTALMAASEQNAHGSTTVRLLLKHPANPNQAQQDGISTLCWSTRHIRRRSWSREQPPCQLRRAQSAIRQGRARVTASSTALSVHSEGAAGAPSRGNHAGNSTGQLAGEVSGCMHDHAAIRIPSTVATPATGAMFREGPVFLG